MRDKSKHYKTGSAIAVSSLLGSILFIVFCIVNRSAVNSEWAIVVGIVLGALSLLALTGMTWRSIWLQKENASLIAAAEMESQRVEEFLRTIAHDLRNSLASVLTGSEVLLSINATQETKPLLQSIQRQATVIARIVDRLVDDFRCSDYISPSFLKHSEYGAVREVGNVLAEKNIGLTKTISNRIPLRILAIDDRRDVILPLRVLLTKEGHEFSEAEDGVSGLEKILTLGPEIVLCDINLPGKFSGLDVARNIRMQGGESGAGIYLVAISGNFQTSDLERSARAGFDFHLAKPITATALRNVIYNRPRFDCTEARTSNSL